MRNKNFSNLDRGELEICNVLVRLHGLQESDNSRKCMQQCEIEKVSNFNKHTSIKSRTCSNLHLHGILGCQEWICLFTYVVVLLYFTKQLLSTVLTQLTNNLRSNGHRFHTMSGVIWQFFLTNYNTCSTQFNE